MTPDAHFIIIYLILLFKGLSDLRTAKITRSNHKADLDLMRALSNAIIDINKREMERIDKEKEELLNKIPTPLNEHVN